MGSKSLCAVYQSLQGDFVVVRRISFFAKDEVRYGMAALGCGWFGPHVTEYSCLLVQVAGSGSGDKISRMVQVSHDSCFELFSPVREGFELGRQVQGRQSILIEVANPLARSIVQREGRGLS